MPNLSGKELSAIGEQLGLEQMLVSKYTTMSNQSSDPQIKNMLSQIGQKHQCHYNELKTFLG